LSAVERADQLQPSWRAFSLTIDMIAPALALLAATLPASVADINAWDVAIVRRAEIILASPAAWNHSDNGKCPATAATFSIDCALQKAIDEALGPESVWSDCAIRDGGNGWEGSCGRLFDEASVFAIARAAAITTGAWRADVKPTAVWAGRMISADGHLSDAAEETVEAVAHKKYPSPLVGYNNDPATTFGDVQAFFRALEERLAKGDTAMASDAVEIEIYTGGTGVIRTYNGWYSVSGASAAASTLKFQIDTAQQIAASPLDREIVHRASTILSSDAVRNRADNRKCDPAAKTWSIYCALEQATIEVTGGFHHRRPALEIVRVIVEDRTKGRKYHHRLMDYNNDPTTRLDDVRSLFEEALAKMKRDGRSDP
jgi:hypothetical protein